MDSFLFNFKVSNKTVRVHQRHIDRMYDRIDQGNPNDCWLWTAGCFGTDYGAISIEKTSVTVTRLLLTYLVGPSDLYALHSCDNPPCCNPRHLSWGTHIENMKEASERNRLPNNFAERNARINNKGSLHHNAKLTEQQVCEIRSMPGVAHLAATRYGVSVSLIHQIRRKEAWQRVS